MHLTPIFARRLLSAALLTLLTVGLAAPVLAQPDQDVVSQVNGDPIARADFLARVRLVRWQYLQEITELYTLTGGNLGLTPAYIQARAASLQAADQLADDVLSQMELERLLWQQGESLGLLPTDAETQQHEDAFFSGWTNVAVESLAADADAQQWIDHWYSAAAEVSGLAREEIRGLFAYDALRDKLYARISAGVPAEEMAAETRHILCSFNPDDPVNPAEPSAEQRASAQACIRQAQMRLANGEDFARVARDLSDDATSAAQGGAVGSVLLSYMADAYAQAVESAAPGSVVGPVETSFGLHLIEVQSRGPRALTEDERAEAQQGYFDLWLQSLRDGATITRSDAWSEGVPTEPGLGSLDPAVLGAVQAVLEDAAAHEG